jgi:DNA-binding transcriptional ArsR family regulator
MGIDDVFAVIAEGTRRQILRSLRDGDKAVGELVVELEVSQPTVSKHLKVLREAGLVTMRAQGQKRFYSLETAPLGLVKDWLAGFEQPAAVSATADPVASDSAPLPVLPETLPPEDADLGILAAAVLAGPDIGAGAGTSDAPEAGVTAVSSGEGVRPPIGRTMGRAAERAADLISQLRRRRDPSS